MKKTNQKAFSQKAFFFFFKRKSDKKREIISEVHTPVFKFLFIFDNLRQIWAFGHNEFLSAPGLL